VQDSTINNLPQTSAQASSQPLINRPHARAFGPKPPSCKDEYNCNACRVPPRYRRIADFQIPRVINQNQINIELGLHSHKKSLKKKNGKSRTVDEARTELIAHYQHMHADQLI
jgi:hypothetical protein